LTSEPSFINPQQIVGLQIIRTYCSECPVEIPDSATTIPVTHSFTFPPRHSVPYVDLINSVEFFSVPWTTDPMSLEQIYPTRNNSCGNGACTPTHDENCLCSITVSERPAFTSLPSRDEVLGLHIGAFHPDTYSDSNLRYSLLESSDGVEAYVSSASGTIGDTSTIFKVTNTYGNTVFFKNLKSTINLGNKYELRNPPSFMNPVRVELRDAAYEGM
jgi:hypothetical protein